MTWRRFFTRAARDADAARELQSYLDIETDENIARGMPPDAARAAARRKLGNVTRVREEIYLMNGVRPLDALWQDTRYALRLLRRDRSLALAAVLSLALGIGANTAIFQLLDAVRLRALPVAGPRELVEVRLPPGTSRTGSFNGRRPMWTHPLVEALRREQQAFTGLAVWSSQRFNIAPGGEVEHVEGIWVSGDFFATLGVTPALGRLFALEEDRRGCAPAAVVSHAYWQRAFGGRPDVLGRTLLIAGRSVPIVGVTAESFFGVDVGRQYDVAIPLCADDALSTPARLDRRDAWWLGVLGRLRPGWTADRASAHLQAISAGLFEATLPATYQADDVRNYLAMRMIAEPAPGGVSGLRGDFGEPLVLLLAIAALVLVVACANLANLLLARATVRERELAARLAMGASRARLVGQLLVESALLAAIGAAAGAWLAHGLSRALVTLLAGSYVSLFVDLAWNGRVLAFTMAVGVFACLLFGVAPALRATTLAPGAVLRSGGRGLTGARRGLGLRRTLVVAQVAVSLVLVAGGVLFTRTLLNLGGADPGFRHAGVLIARLSRLPAARSDEAARQERRALVERIAALPEVARVAEADVVPLAQLGGWNENIRVDGVTDPQGRPNIANFNRVGTGFLRQVGIPLVAGRDFDERDTFASPPVAIVSEGFVRRLIPDGRPLGRTVRVRTAPGEEEPAYEIVGVAADTKYGRLREEIAPLVYVASAQERDPGTAVQLVITPRQSVESVTTAVIRALRGVSPAALAEFTVWEEAIRRSLVRERLMALLSGAFAVLAVVLAAVGLFGLMSYSVARRTNEIGLRLALGATRADVRRLVATDGLRLLAWGVVAGTAVAVFAARSTAALLYGLEPSDPLTFAAAALVLLAVGLVAGLLPAERAARVDPAVALRAE